MWCPNKNSFCYVCALYTPKTHARSMTKAIISGFEKYFVTLYVSKPHTPENACENCYRRLTAVENNKETEIFKIVRHTIWFDIDEHNPDDCYFCLTKPKCFGFSYNQREKIQYAVCESVLPARIRSFETPHSPMQMAKQQQELQRQLQRQQQQASGSSDQIQNFDYDFAEYSGAASTENVASTSCAPTTGNTSEYVAPGFIGIHLITQKDFDDLVREAQMSKHVAEIVGSRLQQWNLVAQDFLVTAARKRKNAEKYDNCFAIREHDGSKLVYCHDIDTLFQFFGITYDSKEWRLFIDGSSASLKAVLLHNGNNYPSVPIAYGRYQKEKYDTIKLMLELIKYDTYKWKVCADLKMVAILCGIKQAYSKQQCLLCKWEGRADDYHYDYEWDARDQRVVGEFSIVFEPLIDAESVILPPLHIKLGLIKNYLVALYRRNPETLEFLIAFFKNQLSPAKVTAGGLNGKQCNQLFVNADFLGMLDPLEKRALLGIRDVCQKFLGNERADNFEEIVDEMLDAFKEMKVHMSV